MDLPATTARCNCNVCIRHSRATGGDPPSIQIPHSRRTHAENTSGNDADGAALSLFTSLVFDDGPDINSQPSRLWTSRDEFQAASTSQSQPSLDAGIASTIWDSIGRLQSSQNTHPAAFILAPKKEKHRATQAAHIFLDNIELRAKHCEDQLDALDEALLEDGMDMSHSPSHEAFRSLHTEFKKVQLALKKVTRDVPSVNARKDTIGILARDIKERLERWGESNPAYNLDQRLDEHSEQPFEYDCSAYFYWRINALPNSH